ncbi:MAG TPA: glucose 1-dehydrogenase [Spirochaetales bacterium]|nr:glucose 1-dehydrogenase [Spirochaetales bacterium]
MNDRTMDNGKLEGKVAFISGAASGIGRGIAVRFAREGAKLALADVKEDLLKEVTKELKQKGTEVRTYRLDISKPKEIEEVVRRIVEDFKRIDIFVNTAGIVQSNNFLDVTEEEWDRVIAVNQKGTAFAVQSVARVMVKQIPEEVKRAGKADRSYGKILNLTSISGRRGRAYQLAYAASKAAVISITQSAALAFAPYNINVNAIAPSVVLTPMWDDNNRQKERAFHVDAQKASDEFIAKIPLKRPGTVEDMAAAALFLCSSESDYITGQTLNVDGGFEMN